MKMKKALSAFTALTMAASAFSAMFVVQANAAIPEGYTALYEKDSTYGSANIWTEEAMAEWTQTNSSTAALALDVPTSADDADAHYGIYYNSTKPGAAYNATKSFDVSDNAIVNYDINWYFGNATGRTSNIEFLQIGSNIVFGWNSDYKVYVSYDGATTWESDAAFTGSNTTFVKNVNCTIDTSTNTITSLTFDGATVATDKALAAGATANSVSFGFIRGGSTQNWGYPNGIQSISVSQYEQTVETAAYKIKYVCNGAEIQDAVSSTGVVGTVPTIDTSNIEITDEETGTTTRYIYVSSDASEIASDGSTVITLTYREASTYTATLTSSVDGAVIASQSDVLEGDSVALYYPAYVVVDKAAYASASTNNSDHWYGIDLDYDTPTAEVTYSATDYDNVAYYSEGEDIEGMTEKADTARMAGGAGGYSTEGVTIATLPAGTYVLVTATRSQSSDTSSVAVFKAGDAIITFTDGSESATAYGYLSQYTSNEFTVGDNTDVTVTSSSASAVMDYILIADTAEPTVDPTATPTIAPTETVAPTETPSTTDAPVDTEIPSTTDVPVETEEPEATEEPTPEPTVDPATYLEAITEDYTFIAQNFNESGTVKLDPYTFLDDNKVLTAGYSGITAATNKGTSTINETSYMNSMRLKGTQDSLAFKLGKDATITVYGQTHASRVFAAGTTGAGSVDLGLGELGVATFTFTAKQGDTVYLTAVTSTANEDGTYSGGDLYTAGFVIDVDDTQATLEPTEAPTDAPTDAPSDEPVETDTPTDAPTDAPSETEAPTDAPTVAPTEIPAGTVLYEQDYDDATEVDWVSPNFQAEFSLVDDGNGGLKVYADHSVDTSQNSRGAYLLFGDLEAGSQYVLEFDMSFTSSNSQSSEFAVLGQDYTYYSSNVNYGLTSGYAIKLDADANTSAWTITDSTATVPTGDNVMYHYSVIVDGNVAYLTVTNGDTTVVEQQTIPVNGEGGLKGLYYVSGRYTAIMSIDNIVLRTPYEDEVPESDTYTVTINTTRYANMTTTDGAAYYANVDGVIEIPLVANGTTMDYTLTKVGYTSVTGSLTVDGADVTEDKPLEFEDELSVFIESDFGNADGAFVAGSGSRSDSISLGSTTLPDVSNVSVDFTFGGFGGNAGQQRTWALVTDAGALVGIQISDDGLYAWTGWTGNSAYNQSSDIGAYTEGQLLSSDIPSGDFSVDFVIDLSNKNITVSYGDVSVALAYTIDATAVTGLVSGLYRYYGELKTNEISISEPDPTYMALAGDTKFAVIPGFDVTREYTKTETVITPGETFTWTVTDANGAAVEGVTAEDGVVTVADTTAAGTYTLTATGSTGKSASLTIEITEPASIASFDVDYPLAMSAGTLGLIYVTNVIDDCDDDITMYIDPTFTSLDEDVLTVDEYGIITAVANGTTKIEMTLGNSGKETVETYEITVGTYYVLVDADGDSTVVDITDIFELADSYLVTTTKDGEIVSQTTVTSDDVEYTGGDIFYSQDANVYEVYYDENGLVESVKVTAVKYGDTVLSTDADEVFVWTDDMVPVSYGGAVITGAVITVDTTGADKVEVAPIYETTIGELLEVPADTYNVTATVGNTRRADLYVNDQMIFNNLNQGSDNWTISRIIADSTDYEAGDIVIGQGYAEFNLQDDQSSGTAVTAVKFVKAPSEVTRAKRIYVLGDSLVAKYYGDAPEGSEGLVRTGWGDVLENYIVDDVAVTNLGNSGVTAIGLYTTAFSNVLQSAQEGDIMILESGYNDASYSTPEEMTEAMTAMVLLADAIGVTTFVVTPNASTHGTGWTDSVRYSSYIRELAEAEGVADKTTLIDLSALSYGFLTDRFGTTATDEITAVYNNSGDKLHSSYNAANCWAAIIANGLYKNSKTSSVVDTSATYSFEDSEGTVTVNALTIVE